MDPSPSQDASTPTIELAGLRARPEALAMVADGREFRSVPTEEIDEVCLAYGSRSRYPLAQAIVGGALVFVGLWSGLLLFNWARYGGRVLDVHFLLPLCVPLGGWLARDASRRGWLVRTNGPGGRRDLSFSSHVERGEAEVFVAAAADVLGLDRLRAD